MKILIIQEKGRHKLNENFRESLNLSRALDRINIDNVVWGKGYDNFKIKFDEISKECDVIILLENYEVNNWIPDLSHNKQLKLFWSIDSHCILNKHINTCNKHHINIVLNAVYGHDKHFKNQKCHYFPNAYPDDLIYPINDIEKIHDIGFCGNYVNRKQWIDNINKKYNIKRDIFVIGKNMVKTINGYKIHFNKNIGGDINFRTFETLGCKTFLLTDKTPGLNDLFKIGEEIIIYNNMNDLLDKINYYLKNEKEREEVTTKGYNKVKQYHTYNNRANELVSLINKNI
jgi:hypothetical protein